MTDRTAPLRYLACALLLCACQSSDGPATGQLAKADLGPVAGAGFSAAVRADLAKATGIPAPASSKGTTAPVSAEPAAAPGAGDKPAATGAGATASAPTPATATATDPKPVAATDPKPVAATDPKPVAATDPKPVAAAANPPESTPASAGKPTTPPTAPPAPVAATVATTATAAGVPAELAAIKLKLNEGWLRDSIGPGTFSFFAPGEGGKNIRFIFKYGYEEATAPLQREPYKQWLASSKIMTVSTDRQRGAAWFLEGVDAAGDASFRYVITYGGRLLTCSGSLYKQGAAAGLRDLRDEIIMQAKRICESMDF